MKRNTKQIRSWSVRITAFVLAATLLLPAWGLLEVRAEETTQKTGTQLSTTASKKTVRKNGFIKKGKKTYYYENGKKVRGQKKIGNYWYMFHPRTGVMITGWYRHTKKTNKGGVKLVYYNSKGRMVIGSKRIRKKTYTFHKKTGALVDKRGRTLKAKNLNTNLANSQENMPKLRKKKAANGTYIWWVMIPRHFKPRLVLPKSGVTGKEKVSSVARRTRAEVVVNAGIWIGSGEPYGITAIGKNIHYTHKDPADTELLMDKNGKLSSKDVITSEMYLKGKYAFAVKGFHPIIQNGTRTGYTFPGRHPRTFIGQLKNGNYFVGVTGGRGVNGIGMTYDELYTFVKTKISKDTAFLYNLDGGGSSCMVYQNRMVNKPTDGTERSVASCLAFY